MSAHNVFVLAQKEFADNINSAKIKTLIFVLISILLSISVVVGKSGGIIFTGRGIEIVQVIGLFFPLLGFALGFDQIIKDRRSCSLVTLLTHPVFRDSIIAGKILGGLLTLFIVISISVAVVFGSMLAISGISIAYTELVRILVFSLITFLYLAVFFALGLLLSTITKDPSNSFICGIVVWIIFVLAFGGITVTLSSIMYEDNLFDSKNENTRAFYIDMQSLSPTNHYAQLTFGISGMSQGNLQIKGERTCKGLFDLSHRLGVWVSEYQTNIVVLCILPLILFIVTFFVFIKKDIA